jgi:hypothetical protein
VITATAPDEKTATDAADTVAESLDPKG